MNEGGHNIKKPKIEEAWFNALQAEFDAPYFARLKAFLKEEKLKHEVFPRGNLIFNAFNATPFDRVKVVVLGQDPYHGDGQAHGLSFSVQDGVKFPPSLRNIFKELQQDVGCKIPRSGNLGKWSSEGVLMLNSVLTVRKGQPGSHQKKGWETFTDAAISALSHEKNGLVFLLWGNYAKAKKTLIDGSKHLILDAAHPSPFSAHNGFFGCGHFSKANAFLAEVGSTPVDWCLAM